MPTTLSLDPALLRKLEALRLSVKFVRWGNRLGGRFVVNRRGSSVEFADYLPYVPGDDIRTIDWNLYARLDRLFVRVYKEEIELAVEVMLDATRSMGLPTPEKFERATAIGLALSYVALAARHQVRVSWIAPGTLATTPTLVRRTDVRVAEQAGAPVQPNGSVVLGDWMQRAAAGLKLRGGQAIVISDCLYRPAELFRALHVLRLRHLEVKLLQVLSPQELQPARLLSEGVVVDSETGRTHELGYSAAQLTEAVRSHNEQLSRFCKRHDIAFAQHRLDEPLESFLLKTLPARGFLE